MAKHKHGPIKMVKPVPTGPAETAAEEKVRYAFASAARCPGCGTADTFVVKTEGNIRYWRCRTPHCRFSQQGGRKTWKEIGTRI